ncbi:MAG: elongation factor Ts [Dehalococcoidales bacterium]|nr:elongation factor Ts [Dehalococcoidales bacterium]
MKISTDSIKELRELSGAGIMDCRNVLAEVKGDMEKAQSMLKERNLFKAEKKKGRSVSQGLIEAYVHAGGRIGAMIELNCETDFAARTNEFKELAHNLALQVAAMPARFISTDEIPAGVEGVEEKVDCLLLQPYIRNLDMTIQDVINETIAKVGENIKISRFVRYEVGEGKEE